MNLSRLSLCAFIILVFSSICFGQRKDSTKFEILIEQIIQPGPNPIYSYKIRTGKIIVYKEPLIFNENVGLKIRKHSKKLNEFDLKSILSILQRMNNRNYERTYSSAVLDGVSWYISIDYLGKNRQIELHNTKLDEISEILDIVNKYKETRNIIRFNILEL